MKNTIEGEWQCEEQEGGHAAPAAMVGEIELSSFIDDLLDVPRENGKSGIKVKITVERV
jgi:hypothetical protein